MGSTRWVFAGLGVGAVGVVAGFVGGLLGESPRSRVSGPVRWTADGPAIPVHALPRDTRPPTDRVLLDKTVAGESPGLRESGPGGRKQPGAQEKTGNRSIPVGTSSSGGR
jgi:hypothetical protein